MICTFDRDVKIIGDIISEIQWEMKSTTNIYLAILQILRILISLQHGLFLFLKSQ